MGCGVGSLARVSEGFQRCRWPSVPGTSAGAKQQNLRRLATRDYGARFGPLCPSNALSILYKSTFPASRGSVVFAELTREELTAGLDRVIEEILAQAGVERPPVDAMGVARDLGISVAWDDRQEGRARYVRFGGQPSGRCRATILLRPEPRFERRQWAVAHEIGEHIAHRVFARWGVDPPETGNSREQVANSLAGRLLLPTTWFEADGTALGWDLLALKARYETASHELIARRMLECRPAVVVSIYDQGKVSFRRSNVSDRVPPPTQAETACQSAVHVRGCPSHARQGPSTIQGWPIHEADWKREILRMEVAES
jgi:hypothetical protein